ncbi:MAG: beta-1,3-glucanase family protein [Simkaniaceae bacterium]|nr:beta-1,3-glucanase family protein [Candidatus Sacchlamyda saccharinae]
MKPFLVLLFCLRLALASDPQRIEDFHTTYLLQSQHAGADALVLEAGPTNGLLPVLIVNNFPASQGDLYVAVTPQSIVPPLTIDTATGIVGAGGTPNSVKVSSLPDASKYISNAPAGKILFVNPIVSGRIYFSLSDAANPMGLQFGSLAPSFTNTSDPNFSVRFDKCEYTYTGGDSPNISCNATAVDFFSLPIQLQVLDGSKGFAPVSHASGLSQTRETVINKIISDFAAAGESTEWEKLFLPTGATSADSIIRVLSAKNGILVFGFDENYFTNLTFDYLDYLWTNAMSFYQNGSGTNKLFIQMPIGAGDAPANGSRVYEADFTTAPDTIVFTQVLPSIGTDQLILSAPTTTGTTTTSLLFQALPLYNIADGDNSSHPGDVQQISQLFSEAIICGMLPRNIPDKTVPLRTVPPGSHGNANVNPNNGNVNDSPTDANQKNNLASTFEHINSFYQFNAELETGTIPLAGTTASTGPWFDLYGSAIHNLEGPATGLVYTYGFDEGMYPQVLIDDQPVTSTTLLQITVGGVPGP